MQLNLNARTGQKTVRLSKHEVRTLRAAERLCQLLAGSGVHPTATEAAEVQLRDVLRLLVGEEEDDK